MGVTLLAARGAGVAVAGVHRAAAGWAVGDAAVRAVRLLALALTVWRPGGGTVRVGALMTGAVWWYQAAGLPLPVSALHALGLLLGMVVLTAIFNAGRRSVLSPTEEVVFCGLLAALAPEGAG